MNKNLSKKLLILCALVQYSFGILTAQNNCLAPAPPMGWNSWNCFHGQINEEKIKGVADAIVKSGMKDAGYQYIVIDDMWHQGRVKGGWIKNPEDIPGRDASGVLLPDSVKFPHGIKALADYVHSLGLKFGIYTAPGKTTCTICPGSEGYEEIDIKTFVDWGVDFIKLDRCGAKDITGKLLKWRNLLNGCGRQIILSINGERNDDYSLHREVADMWRTTNDIMPVWSYEPEDFRVFPSVLEIIHQQVGLEEYQGNCKWNDPDMLQVGNARFNFEENKSHFSMWAMLGAPLIAGNDLRNMNDSVIEILTNKEVIAIDQDLEGTRGIKVYEFRPGLEIWIKKLRDAGTLAVALLNTTNRSEEIRVKWNKVGLAGAAFVRDLWCHEDMGNFADSYQTLVPPHGVAMLKVSSINQLPIKDPKISEPMFFDGNNIKMESESSFCIFETGSIARDLEGYSGNGYFLGRNHEWAAAKTTWRIIVPEAGTYHAKIRYKNLNGRSIKCKVSNTKFTDVLLEPSGEKWDDLVLELSLKKGINWINIRSTKSDENEIAIDYLKLKKLK